MVVVREVVACEVVACEAVVHGAVVRGAVVREAVEAVRKDSSLPLYRWVSGSAVKAGRPELSLDQPENDGMRHPYSGLHLDIGSYSFNDYKLKTNISRCLDSRRKRREGYGSHRGCVRPFFAPSSFPSGIRFTGMLLCNRKRSSSGGCRAKRDRKVNDE
ncbi:hypothetical protein [Bifidobacterium sp. ESL0704]|uniref:hypothetical protein n=1 Tax=Bifidobacterium sp. ESL0704 TaxID=2983219 RepID=UPI0023F75098|nr:hypothetical protein [Bifidobacterium sp. ESL0704]WEV53579.1 hypothetical protein OZX64_03705 [Bifidobacterium sp. ESL0704]